MPQTIDGIKNVLTQRQVITLGFRVYASFESADVARTGRAPMPGKREKLLGGHAVACCGYDDLRQEWLLRNSWGADWGMGGYFTLPYPYLTSASLAGDLWWLSKVE